MSAQVHNADGSDVEAINTNIVTLTRFLTEEQAKHKEATGDFTYVLPPIRSYRDMATHHMADDMTQVFCATLCSSPSSPLPTTSVAQP